MNDMRLESDALAQAWNDYKADGDQDARNLLILHYMPLLRAIASKVSAQLPKMIDRDDLISYGLFGLMDAIDKYDPERKVKFETYAGVRIRGSIFDEIRGLDWVPRTVRARARDVERVKNDLHARLGRPAIDAEIAKELGIELVDLWQIEAQTEAGNVGHFHEVPTQDGGFSDSVPMMRSFDPASNPEDIIGTQEVAELLADAINSMSERFKTILVLYYLHEMTLSNIGEVLGVTESRVCQLQSKLLQTLHESLANGFANDA